MEDKAAFDVEGCLAGVRLGNQNASAQLVEFLYPVVIRVVRSNLPRHADEQDLAQEIFMKMFSRLDQYHGKMPLQHWVSRIAVTTCIDALRSRQRKPELRWADFTEEEETVFETLNADDSTSRDLDSRAAREVLEKLLAQLKPEERLIIRLMELEEKSVAEVVALTGWNTAVVKVRAFRARAKLKSLVARMEKKSLP
ncbi:MAG: sigma-70 family RNA polymerase sigma factor [Verrucomicrobiae bacterium]|nr:sigma-70 family RNA polymerase sigma factor [Verrucomicrobiae bacterium]